MATEQSELDLSYGLRYQVQEITWDGRDSRQRGCTSRRSVAGGNGGGDSRRRWRWNGRLQRRGLDEPVRTLGTAGDGC
ncbi:hypothetical protein E2562_014945 [Oryza meyeriana var. granulata]|uniref:Uncharacterized protein n=1 Tax=Oryza meyeriana var. granulata TaxID=110450 RepID=A0A6G1EJ53_9ORYZ|nr:hypothetical protein E2562_014945 [Oryza meyeriana var. granulata]